MRSSRAKQATSEAIGRSCIGLSVWRLSVSDDLRCAGRRRSQAASEQDRSGSHIGDD